MSTPITRCWPYQARVAGRVKLRPRIWKAADAQYRLVKYCRDKGVRMPWHDHTVFEYRFGWKKTKKGIRDDQTSNTASHIRALERRRHRILVKQERFGTGWSTSHLSNLRHHVRSRFQPLWKAKGRGEEAIWSSSRSRRPGICARAFVEAVWPDQLKVFFVQLRVPRTTVCASIRTRRVRPTFCAFLSVSLGFWPTFGGSRGAFPDVLGVAWFGVFIRSGFRKVLVFLRGWWDWTNGRNVWCNLTVCSRRRTTWFRHQLQSRSVLLTVWFSSSISFWNCWTLLHASTGMSSKSFGAHSLVAASWRVVKVIPAPAFGPHVWTVSTKLRHPRRCRMCANAWSVTPELALVADRRRVCARELWALNTRDTDRICCTPMTYAATLATLNLPSSWRPALKFTVFRALAQVEPLPTSQPTESSWWNSPLPADIPVT